MLLHKSPLLRGLGAIECCNLPQIYERGRAFRLSSDQRVPGPSMYCSRGDPQLVPRWTNFKTIFLTEAERSSELQIMDDWARLSDRRTEATCHLACDSLRSVRLSRIPRQFEQGFSGHHI